MYGYVLILVTFGLMWLLFIRPQQRRVREHQLLVSSLQEGDHVMMQGGLHGTVVGVDDDIVLLDIAPEVTVRVARAAIALRIDPDPVPDDLALDVDEIDLDATDGDVASLDTDGDVADLDSDRNREH